MHNGRIIEQGTYNSLLALDSAFVHLVNTQDLSTAEEHEDSEDSDKISIPEKAEEPGFNPSGPKNP